MTSSHQTDPDTPRSWWSTKRDGKFGLLDPSLHLITAPQLDQSAAMCSDGQIRGIVDGKWKLYSRDGAEIDLDDTVCDGKFSSRRNVRAR